MHRLYAMNVDVDEDVDVDTFIFHENHFFLEHRFGRQEPFQDRVIRLIL